MCCAHFLIATELKTAMASVDPIGHNRRKAKIFDLLEVLGRLAPSKDALIYAEIIRPLNASNTTVCAVFLDVHGQVYMVLRATGILNSVQCTTLGNIESKEYFNLKEEFSGLQTAMDMF